MISLFEDDEQLSEFDIAWHSRDTKKLQELADSFKEKPENELFAIMNDLTYGKKDRNLSQSENYSKFWIDTSLSQHPDCIIAVQTMNLLSAGLSDQAHYNYYLKSVPQGKRFGKWAKLTEDNADILIIKVLMAFYSINYDDALMYKNILQRKNKLQDVLKKAKALVTDDFIKTITKNIKEQKTFKKKALEW